MPGSQSSSVGPLALPLARWTGLRSEIHLEADADLCPLLQEADVVGKVVVDGHADINPREMVVTLQVRCTTREICGRSLEEFEHPLEFPVHILLRRSNTVLEFEWEDDGDETFEASISEHLRELDISEVLRQAVVLERPISPVKPGTPLPEGVLEEDDQDGSTDPRWDALRKMRSSEN
jgi:uncharacterized metal-binding protein YceD (DUF177 family)